MSRIVSSRVLAAWLLLPIAGCAVEELATDESVAASSAPASASSGQLLRSARPVPGQYLVVLRDGELAARGEGAAQAATELARAASAELLFTYQHSIAGFAARMSEAAARELLADPRVDFIAEDGVVEANANQLNPTWGLDRIDQRNLPLTTSYSYVTTGAGVHAYVIDTGIRRTHVEFTGRIGNHFDYSGGLAVDCNGHGTHLSGTIGGTTYGVAKRVTLHPVKVLDCNGSGSFAQVIAGVDWVTGNRILPAVADLSLGGAPNAALDAAVQRSINRGVVYVVSAGSSGGSACNYSPARIPAAYTVGSSTIADAAHAASNKGPCLDLFAPGINVLSAWHTGDTAWANLSGTSMAAAHAAGAAARYLQSGGSAAYLISMSSVNLLTGVPPDTVNRLLYISP